MIVVFILSINYFNDSQSEKKYNTKAATEYRKHLAKLVQESGPSSTKVSASETNKGSVKEVPLDDTDNIVASLTLKSDAPRIGSTVPGITDSGTSKANVVPGGGTPATVFRAVPAAIGSLSVAAVAGDNGRSAINTDAKPGTSSIPGETAISTTGGAVGTLGMLGGTTSRTAKAPAKKLGARKLVTKASTDTKIDSFEAVEKRTALAIQSDEDHKIAQQLQASLNSGVSGGSSDSTPSTSLYRDAQSSSSASIQIAAKSVTTSSYAPLKTDGTVPVKSGSRAQVGDPGDEGMSKLKESVAGFFDF